ncbi:MAG: RNA 2',3'-cyclic phosphodiesterase [Spirochaetaceae bacterium]|jgi:2'-5' RNA ligase|nr:RNA 2',3'-cyclic phosphodiesterase [Spirochaetaceae bacterium]
MRLFIAVNFDEEFTGYILKIQERLRALAVKGNFSRRGNLHLTLVFLGETSADLVPAIRRAITAIPLSGAFTVEFNRAGFFRHSGKELWYIGAAPGSGNMERLFQLRTRLVEELAAPSPAGILSFDRRPFNAHITLGRELRLREELAPFPVLLKAPIKRISLMQSEHRDGRLVYTELFGRDL